MLTFEQLRAMLAETGKSVQQAQLYRYLKALGITPQTRTRPRLYADDAPIRILAHLGFPQRQAPAADQDGLFNCPVCHRGPFTQAGLIRHRCRPARD